MKLQFAFNPRKKSKRSSKRKKKVARSMKKPKTKKVNKKKGALVAKKRKVGSRRKAGKRSRKNPKYFIARREKKVVGRGRVVDEPKDVGPKTGAALKARAKYEAAPPASKAKARLRKALVKAEKALNQSKEKIGQEEKTAQRYAESGAEVKWYSTKGGKVAKRRKKRGSKKSKAKKVAKVSKKRRTKKKKASKKRGSRRASRKQLAALRKARKALKSASRKKSKKAGKRKSAKRASKRRSRRSRRHYPKLVTHRHSSSVRHIPRRARVKVRGTYGKGKRKVKVTGFFKFNPRRNPMANIKAVAKQALGLDTKELTALALGGALVPVFNATATKVPGVSTVVGYINQYLGPQAAGSAIPILAGALLNLVGDKAKGQVGDYAKLAGEGLVSAGVIGLAMSLSQRYITPALGMAGVNYTPTMRGLGNVRYTPNGMRGINYTPEMRGMGIVPTLNGMGRSPDFGKSADYGGSGGYTEDHRFSKSDFGAHAMDEDSDEAQTEDDILSDNLSGSMS